MEEPQLLGHEETRRQRVHADAGMGKMDRQPLREVAHRRLGCRIGGHFGERHEGAHRRDVDDGSLALRDHPAGKGLGRQKRAHEIEVEHLAETGGIEIEERLGRRAARSGGFVEFDGRAAPGIVAAGAVDQQIGRAPEARDRLAALPELDRIQDVALKAQGGPSGPDDGLRPGFGLFQTDVQHGHLHAHRPQGVGHGAAQLAAAAGDDGNFSGQIETLQNIAIHATPIPVNHKPPRSSAKAITSSQKGMEMEQPCRVTTIAPQAFPSRAAFRRSHPFTYP